MGMFAGVFPFVSIPEGNIEYGNRKEEGVYTLKVKNGDVRYELDKHGDYRAKRVDFTATFERLGEALSEFLAWADDDLNQGKVTLTYNPKGGKK